MVFYRKKGILYKSRYHDHINEVGVPGLHFFNPQGTLDNPTKGIFAAISCTYIDKIEVLVDLTDRSSVIIRSLLLC